MFCLAYSISRLYILFACFVLGAGLNPKQAHKSQTLFLPTPFQEVQTTLPSQARVLPSPFQNRAPHQEQQTSLSSGAIADKSANNKADNKSDDFATEIHQLIKDVYSEVQVPFHPLQEQNYIPDYIFLQQNIPQGEGYVLFCMFV
jgi:hypothetical protein